VVEVTPVGKVALEQKTPALVDSGSEHVLAAPWLRTALELSDIEPLRRMPLGMGGETIMVDFLDIRLRLHPPAGDQDLYVEWATEVGFVSRWRPYWSVLLGQTGFLDQFTATLHRQAQALAIEEFDAFDRRFGSRLR